MNIPNSIPKSVLEDMKTMTPAMRKEVIAYYVRNDQEEAKAKQQWEPPKPIPPAKKPAPRPEPEPTIPARVDPGMISKYIRNPNEATIPEPKQSYSDELYSKAVERPPEHISLFDRVLNVEGNLRGLEPEHIKNLKNWAWQVAQMESEGIANRTQNDDPDGIGRGKYQFEWLTKSGKGGTNITARNRLDNWEAKYGFKLPIPKEDRKELQSDNPDFSKLSEDTQDALFIIHHSFHEKTPLTQIAKGEYSGKKAWKKFHWAGTSTADASQYDARWESKFNEDPILRAMFYIKSKF